MVTNHRIQVDVEQHGYCLETLANQLRLDILRILDERGRMNVTELAAETGVERSRVSHALANLKQCHLITAVKEGRMIRYALDEKTPIFQRRNGNLFDAIEQHARTRCPSCAKYRERVRAKR